MGVTAYIGLGSNLDDPVSQVRRALKALDHLPHSRCVRHSTLYRSQPLGPSDQPEYINAVAELEAGLLPEALLAALQEIERDQGRVRSAERWGPRPLDLDILLYGNGRIETPDLQIPHPEISGRPFVLYPLHEVAGNVEIPGLGCLRSLLEYCPAAGLEPLDES